jgi:hypothetical protein
VPGWLRMWAELLRRTRNPKEASPEADLKTLIFVSETLHCLHKVFVAYAFPAFEQSIDGPSAISETGFFVNCQSQKSSSLHRLYFAALRVNVHVGQPLQFLRSS